MAVDDRENAHFSALSLRTFAFYRPVQHWPKSAWLQRRLPLSQRDIAHSSKVVIQKEAEMTNAGILYWAILKGRSV
jgi:hypothetical protein